MAGQKKNSQLLSSNCAGVLDRLPSSNITGIPPPGDVDLNRSAVVHIDNGHRSNQDNRNEKERSKSSSVVASKEKKVRLSWHLPSKCCRQANIPSTIAADQHRLRRASLEEQRPLSTKSNHELRRCKSEVTQPTDSSLQRSDAPAQGVVQNAFTSKDKIQAFARTARELRTLKLHYYPESGWGWIILFCASLTQCVLHGLLLSAGTLMTATVRRYGWTITAYNQQQPLGRQLLQTNSQSIAYVTAASVQSVAHYQSVYLSSPVDYPVVITSPAAGALAALSLCIASILSPVIVAWCRRKSTRLTAVFGGLLAALGLLFTSFASQFHQLFLSYGLVLGIGVGLTRDTATLMVGQYFKRRREAVEIALVGSSGVGLALMTVFLHTTLGYR